MRGLNDRDNCATAKLFIKRSKCGVICLQETKLPSVSSVKFFTFCGFHIRDFWALNASGTRGVSSLRGTPPFSTVLMFGSVFSQ